MHRAWWLPVIPLLLISALVFEANGPTPTSIVSLTLPALFISLALKKRAMTFAVVLLGASFVAARVSTAPASAMDVCVEGECSRNAQWWQRVIDEREATRAGLYVSGHLGAMRGVEFTRFDQLIDAQWKSAPKEWRGAANPLLMHSTPQRVESLVVHGVGAKRPAIIFLHGFGGLLSLYVRALAEGTRGEFEIIAPALDLTGAWWTERGQAVIAHTLDTLPPEVDRERVFLIGLSNGGIGASTVLLHPRLAKRFAGVVLLSGIGELQGLEAPPPTRVLLVSGTDDPRFSGDWLEDQHQQLVALGADITWKTYRADHFLLLTHTQLWTRAFVEWSRES
ncbi:MAG: hypothetical protein JNM17_39975 [Archangium sp.]|nr:hypothetical protein [Archangium sp.]